MTYRHTQVGTVIIIAVLCAAIVTLFVLVMGAGPSWFSPLTVLAITGVVLAMFSSLTVEVEKSTLTCWFGVGFVRKTILLSEVDQVRAVENPWFVGWGIRWIPGSYWVHGRGSGRPADGAHPSHPPARASWSARRARRRAAHVAHRRCARRRRARARAPRTDRSRR